MLFDMSNSYLSQHHLTANASSLPKSDSGPKSTLAKKKFSTDKPFKSQAKQLEEVRNQLSREMDGHWVGVMPVEDFHKDFLPPTNDPLPHI